MSAVKMIANLTGGMPMQEGGPVAIEQWAEVHKDAFKPPICNKVSSSVCLCNVMTTSLAPLSSCVESCEKM
jgi:hypothetical protein